MRNMSKFYPHPITLGDLGRYSMLIYSKISLTLVHSAGVMTNQSINSSSSIHNHTNTRNHTNTCTHTWKKSWKSVGYFTFKGLLMCRYIDTGIQEEKYHCPQWCSHITQRKDIGTGDLLKKWGKRLFSSGHHQSPFGKESHLVYWKNMKSTILVSHTFRVY